MPFHRWFAELGWRHIVGVLAIAFAVFPIMFVISASLNESGSIAAAGLLPRRDHHEHYAVMLSGERANFLRWYLNTSSCAVWSPPGRCSSRCWPPTPSAVCASAADAAACSRSC